MSVNVIEVSFRICIGLTLRVGLRMKDRIRNRVSCMFSYEG